MWGLIARVLLIAAALALSAPADAHEFYSVFCCNDQDCAPVPDSAVDVTRDGYVFKPLNVTVPYGDKRIQFSPDGRYHACILVGEYRERPTLRCLYVPARMF